MKMWYVYLLLCDQKTFYTGMTDDLGVRLAHHRQKTSFYTKQFSDIQLVYCEKYSTKHEAALRERQIKGWSSAKKQMLVEGILEYNACPEIVDALRDWNDLVLSLPRESRSRSQ